MSEEDVTIHADCNSVNTRGTSRVTCERLCIISYLVQHFPFSYAFNERVDQRREFLG